MTPQAMLRDGILAALPSLRAFAISLAHDVNTADDLVQETILKAWTYAERFQAGSNLNAWLFTILRNQFYTRWRRTLREIEDEDGTYAARLTVAPSQLDCLDVQDLREALGKLSPEQREAVLLVGASGFSYEDAAEVMGVAVGTAKSRVHRARVNLARMLSMSSASDVGADGAMLAALHAA